MAESEQMTNAVTLGEVNRKVDTVLSTIGDLSTSVGQLPTYRDHSALETRVSKVEDWQTWALRLLVGGLVLAALGAFLTIKGVGI